MDILELMAVLSFGLTCFGIGYSTLSEQGDTRLKYRFLAVFTLFTLFLLLFYDIGAIFSMFKVQIMPN